MESTSFWLDAGEGNSSLTTAELGHDMRNPITEGIAFSISFIISYQWTLVAFTLLCSLRHYYFGTVRAERLRNKRGSTHIEDEQTKDNYVNSSESTSLLSNNTSHVRPSSLQLSYRRLKSFLMYQPLFHPEATAGETTLLVTILFAINVFYAFYKIPFTLELVMVSADRFGLMFMANLPWLYLLSAKNQPFRFLTGWSYERLNAIHQALGKWMTILAIAHVVGMVMLWYNFLLPRGLDAWWYISRYIIWIGLIAFISYQILAITSHILFRQWWYEMFLACHIIFQALGLIFLFLHHSRLRIYVGVSLCIFLIDRIAFRLVRKTRTFHADLRVLKDGHTIMISSSWPLLVQPSSQWSWLCGRPDLRYGWHAADHVFLTIPALAKKHALQAHPFTIASAAPEDGQEHAWFNLIIRVRDGFTKDLLRYAEQQSSVSIRLDGPYGSMHAFEMLQSHDVSLIIAGGSGIAVAYPLLWKLMHSDVRHRVRACLIWIVHDASHIDWLGAERLNELEGLGLKVVVPPPTSKAGRPDIPALIRDNIRELKSDDIGQNAGVIVSGPDAMNRMVRNTCAKMAWKGEDIDVAVEVFDW